VAAGPVRNVAVVSWVRRLPPKSFIRQYFGWAGRKTAAPFIYHISCALSCIAPLLPPQLNIPSYSAVYPLWWGTLIGEHGTTFKSTCLGFAEDLLLEINPDLVDEPAGSWEGQVESIRSQPTQLIVHSDFGTFLEQTAQGYMRGVRDYYLKLWDCRPIGRRLAGSDSGGKIVDHRVSVIGGVTPEQLEKGTSASDWENGFMSRWCHLAGVPELPGWKRPTGGDKDRKFLVEKLQIINAIPLVPCSGFTPEAAVLHERYQKGLIGAMATGSPLMRGTYSRAGTLALRIAMLLAADFDLIGGASAWVVTPEILRPAYGLVDFHLQTTAWLLATVCSTPYQRQRRSFLAVLPEDGSPVPLSYIAGSLRLEPRKLRDVITGLEAEKAVIAVTNESGEETCYKRMTRAALVTAVRSDAFLNSK